jgi:outer membrane protein assembly factor BamB
MRGVDMSRTGIAPGPAPTGSPRERWRTPTGWHSDAQPIVARGLVYFGGFSLGERTPQLVAVEEGSGRVRWQTTAPVAWAEFPDAPALASDTLFAPVQAPVAGIMAVAASTGDPLWFAPFGFTSLTAPAADAEALFVAGWSVRNPRDRTANDAIGTVIALDQRTGREIWRYLAPARFDTVAVGATLVYVPSDRGLFALDRRTGAKRWQARFSPGAGESAVVAGDRVVFAGWEITSAERGIFALDAASGALAWRHELAASSSVRAGTAAVAGTMFVTSWESDPEGSGVGAPALQAFEIASGAKRWTYRAGGSGLPSADVGSGWVSPPVIVADSVIFGVAVRDPTLGAEKVDGLYAVDIASGQLLWHAATDPIRSAPSVVDEVIYTMGGLRARGGATGGNLYAFSAD